MNDVIRTRDRRSGAMLVAFVALQMVYLIVNVGVIRPPAPDAPIHELRATVVEHAGTIRWHSLLALTGFFGLFLPGVAGLRHRLHHATPERDLIGQGAMAIIVSVVLTVTSVAVLGLVPSAELSDSVLRTILMVDTYSAWVIGTFAGALFLTAASIAMLGSEHPPRWLARAGLATAGLGLIGSLWLIGGDTGGPLFAIAVISRAALLAWIAATGVWLHRTAAAASTSAPAPAMAA